MRLFHLQRSTIVILGIFAAFLWYPTYIGVLQFIGYHVVTNTVDPESAKQAALKDALEKKDAEICKKIVVPFYYMGPAEYDLVNGCYMGYIYETNDISLCGEVISSAGCVTAIAERTNNPDLCKKAYFPEYTMFQENRGTCFGYFAKREREYEYCQKLEKLADMNENQKIVCMMLYVDSTGDASFCPVHDEPDICYNKAARISGDVSICNAIVNEEKRNRCKMETAQKNI